MSRLFEDFLSNKWNIYGLQTMAGSLMIMVLHNYLTIFEMLVMAICVFLISFSQRLLGIRYGMLFYEANEDKIGRVINEIKKINEEEKDE